MVIVMLYDLVLIEFGLVDCVGLVKIVDYFD